jgi:hypothetical protein
MKGSSHAVAGAVTGIAISTTMHLNPITTIGMTLLGALIVDIDEEHSKINKILFPVAKENRWLVKALVGAAMIASQINSLQFIGIILLLSLVSARVKYKFSLWNGFQEFKYHRTFFHDPIIGGLLLTAPLYALGLSQALIIPYVVGVLSHYVLDLCTAYGLPLYLLGGKRLRFPIINYHSGNNLMEYGLLACYCVAVFTIAIKPAGFQYLQAFNNQYDFTFTKLFGSLKK